MYDDYFNRFRQIVMLTSLVLLAVCVVIQSIYGVGLLIFGTPILLLNGVDFFSVLGFLLPSSIMISLIQIYETRESAIRETRLIPLATLGIFIGVIFLKINSVPAQMAVVMTVAMFVTATLRSFPKAMKYLGSKLDLYGKAFHFLNAFFHGFSNMGGTLLSVYSTTVYSDKVRAIRCTAIFYFIYALSQIITITLLGNGAVFFQGSMLTPGALLIYLIFGRYSFKIVSDKVFYHLSTVFFWAIAFVFLAESITSI